MDSNAIPISENSTVIVKCSGDLFVDSIEQNEVRFQSGEDRIKVNQSTDNIYIETHASMDLSVPRSASVIVERVGGSAFLQDLQGVLTIQKIGGDLALRRLGKVRIEKVGGSCMIDTVNDGLSISKIGGDLTAREIAGPCEIGSVGGSISLQVLPSGAVEARAGGDLNIYYAGGLGEKGMFKAGGSIEFFLPATASGKFLLLSNGEHIDLNLRQQGESQQVEEIHARRHEFTLGDGAAGIEAIAGGDIRVSDEQVEPEPVSEELERRENAWKEARERKGHPSWSGGFGFDRSSAWADMISRRAQEAARRAEQRAQSAIRRTEDQIRQAAERELRRSEWQFRGGPPVPPPPPAPASAPSQPVTEKERLMILQMLQEGKINVEQAETLLAALEGRFKE